MSDDSTIQKEDDMGDMTDRLSEMMIASSRSFMDNMAADFVKQIEAAKPYNWQQSGKEDIAEETVGEYRLVQRRLTWTPPEKTDAHWMNWNVRGEPDGMDEHHRAMRWYVYGDKYHDYEYRIFGSEEKAREHLAKLTVRDANLARIESVIAIFKENGFHHGEYYSPCDQSMSCSACVDAAMEVLSIT